MKPLSLSAALLVVVAVGPGCATIVANGPDKVQFESTPNGATVHIDGQSVGSTPIEADVPRNVKYVTMSLSGYEDEMVPIPRRLNGWVFGNMLFGGLIGVAIDMSTGNHMVANSEAHAHLKRRAPTSLSESLLP